MNSVSLVAFFIAFSHWSSVLCVRDRVTDDDTIGTNILATSLISSSAGSGIELRPQGLLPFVTFQSESSISCA